MPGESDREQSERGAEPVSRQELQAEVNELRAVLRDTSGRLLDLQRRVNRLEPETENCAASGNVCPCCVFPSPAGTDSRGR